MITINEDFQIDNDAHGWVVHHWRDGVNPKTKEPTRRSVPKYFGNLYQCCNYILNSAVKDCKTTREILDTLDEIGDKLIEAIEQYE